MKTTFTLTDLNCDACGKVSELKIKKISGVTSVTIEQIGNEAHGELESDRAVTIEEIQDALSGTAYKVFAAK
jgi:copper chaperone CopZ